jgi:hypothetical protein
MSLLVERCLKRSFLLEELYEHWQIDRHEAELAGDLQELSSECLQLAELVAHAFEQLSNEFFRTGFGDFAKPSRALRLAIRKTTGVIELVMNLAAAHAQQATSGEPLRLKLESLRDIDRKAAEYWAAPDAAMAEQARADYERGDYRLAEDLARELQGHHP